MAVTIIAVNQTAGALSLPNIPVADNQIAAGVDVQTNLTDFASVQQIQSSTTLVGYINADQVLLNDGTKTLTKQQSLNLLTPTISINKSGSNAGGRKEPCRAATTANITSLSTGAPNTVDGVSLAVEDRILVKDQSTGSQNGIYEVVTVGTGSNGVWERAFDADSSAEMIPGMDIRIQEGSTYAKSVFYLTTTGTITLDTTALSFDSTLAGLKTASYNGVYDNGTISATTHTIDWNNGQNQQITLGNNVTISFTDPPGPSSLKLIVLQDGTGNRSITWSVTLQAPGGVLPTLSSGINQKDLIPFFYQGSSIYITSTNILNNLTT